MEESKRKGQPKSDQSEEIGSSSSQAEMKSELAEPMQPAVATAMSGINHPGINGMCMGYLVMNALCFCHPLVMDFLRGNVIACQLTHALLPAF